MKITIGELRQIIKEEIRNASLNEKNTSDKLSKEVEKSYISLDKFIKKFKSDKGSIEKSDVQNQLDDINYLLQQLSDIKKELSKQK